MYRLHQNLYELLSSRTHVTICGISLLLLITLGYLDYHTGGYSLIVFYVFPVSLTAWFAGKRTGIVFCILAGLTRLSADEASTSFTFNSSSLHYWNIFIEFAFLVIMSLLFSALQKTLKHEKTLARVDPLTGALNRRAFFDMAEYEIQRSRRYAHPLTVAYIDLDNFKELNDKMGHHTGDELLITVVDTIRENMRRVDILARFGGDEFVLLVPETAGDSATVFLDKLHRRLLGTMQRHHWPVTFSIGAVSYVTAPSTVDEIIRRADVLMYDVKRAGKNRLHHLKAAPQSGGEG